MQVTEQLAYLWNFIEWRTAIDVAFIAAGLLFFYRTFQTSGTWKLVLGVVLSLFVFFAALALELAGVLWIFSNLANVFLILLIVLFQPELRRMLERAASFRFRSRVREESRASGVIAELCFELIERKQGALIVFPGEESVQAWLSGGQRANAEPSLSLLLSIFDPHSPGHDGAVIMEAGRIARFAARLPIQARQNLAEKYGTRHHAALGLSENTDALVAAVSEERGQVSLFEGGRMETVENPTELARRIQAHQEKRATPGLRWNFASSKERRRLLVEVSACLGLAALLWAGIIFSEGKLEQIEVAAPVAYANRPASVELTGVSAESVSVVVSGPQGAIAELAPGEARVRMDLSDLQPGERSYPINAGNVFLPPELRFVRADPSFLLVSARPAVRVRAEVRLRYSGLPADEDLRIEQPRIQPQRVAAYLADPGRFDQRDEVFVETLPIDLGDLTRPGTYTRVAEIAAPDWIRPLEGEWPRIRVRFRVFEEGDAPPQLELLDLNRLGEASAESGDATPTEDAGDGNAPTEDAGNRPVDRNPPSDRETDRQKTKAPDAEATGESIEPAGDVERDAEGEPDATGDRGGDAGDDGGDTPPASEAGTDAKNGNP